MFKKINSLVILLLTSQIFALDLPQFYRTTLFQGETKPNVDDFRTYIDIRYGEGSTKKAWNNSESKTNLFNAYGYFDMRKLAANLQNLSSKTVTNQYLNPTNGTIAQLYDGKLEFKGEFKTKEIDITLQQGLISGFYIQAYVPIRELKVNNIDYIQAVTTNSEHTTLDNFVKNNLDDILAENEIEPLKTPFNKSGIADIMISLGWHGKEIFENNTLNSINGYIQTGLLIPFEEEQNTKKIFSLPLGHNGHWGINVRTNACGTIFKKLTLGANAGISLFFKKTYDLRMTTSTSQNGWVLLEKGTARVDYGSIWDVGIYAKADHLFGGFSALIGYSYTQQEKTKLSVVDNNFLKDAIASDNTILKDEIVNSNSRLNEWHQHVIHALAQYDFKAHTNSNLAPLFEIAYDYPISGKHCFTTDIISGTVGLNLGWNF